MLGLLEAGDKRSGHDGRVAERRDAAEVEIAHTLALLVVHEAVVAPDGAVVGERVIRGLPGVVLAVLHVHLAVDELPGTRIPNRRAERSHSTSRKTGAVDLGTEIVHGCVDSVHKRLARLVAELVGVQRVGEVVVDVRRVERRNEVGKGVAVCGLIEAAKGRLAGDVEFVGELSGGPLRELRDSFEQL